MEYILIMAQNYAAVETTIAKLNERLVEAFNECMKTKPSTNEELLAYGRGKNIADTLAKFPFHPAAKSEDERARILFYIAVRLEDGCRRFAVAGRAGAVDCYAYATITHQICDYLRDSHAELLTAILTGKLHPSRVALTEAQSVCPSFLRVEREEFELRSQQKIAPKLSHLYTCRKCGKKETNVREVQTRSSDEAPTIFIQCAACGQCWTLGG